VQLVRSQKQSGVLEAENLPFAASPDTKATREDARLDWSGWSQLLYEGGKFGDWLEVKLPADIKDRFHLSARGTLGPDYGIAQAFLGDQPVGKPADGYAEALRLSPENGLGKVELTGGENNRLRFQITGKAEKSSGYRLGLDYFRLNALVVENAIEAEGLKIVQQEMSNAYAQGMADFGADKWSGAQQLFCPGRKGQFVVLEVPVAEAGRYLLDIYFTKAADYGIVEVGLDGKRIGLPFDGYSGGVIPSGKVSYGECELTAGSHLLRLEVNGKNQASSNYGMGIDCLTLTPTGAAARRFGQHALNL
ncbi:MAG: hypothetical protein KKD76_05870, partial [Verrucomicrobia bacterium]|nr:hypothetical protein [Verrucomicrobiota bacterium]